MTTTDYEEAGREAIERLRESVTPGKFRQSPYLAEGEQGFICCECLLSPMQAIHVMSLDEFLTHSIDWGEIQAACAPPCAYCGQASGDGFYSLDMGTMHVGLSWSGPVQAVMVRICDDCMARRDGVSAYQVVRSQAIVQVLRDAEPAVSLRAFDSVPRLVEVCGAHPLMGFQSIGEGLCRSSHESVEMCQACGEFPGVEVRRAVLHVADDAPLRGWRGTQRVDLVRRIEVPHFAYLCQPCAWHWPSGGVVEIAVTDGPNDPMTPAA